LRTTITEFFNSIGPIHPRQQQQQQQRNPQREDETRGRRLIQTTIMNRTNNPITQAEAYGDNFQRERNHLELSGYSSRTSTESKQEASMQTVLHS
jgi:hypothetical protein